MNKKVIFWLEPNQSLVPVEQIPGAIAEARYPFLEGSEADGQALNDPDTANRLREEREQAKQFRISHPNLPSEASFTICQLIDYLRGLNLEARFIARTEREIESVRTNEEIAKTPQEQAEQLIAWYDQTIDAALWWRRNKITAKEAAMLLCRLNPLDDNDDPLLISTNETTPNDFKRLLRVFDDDGNAGMPLAEWLDIAKRSGLKYHSWIDEYIEASKRAKQLCECTSTEPQPHTPPMVAGTQTGVISHKLSGRRTHALSAVIRAAKQSAKDGSDYQSVWAELVRMAEKSTRPAPIIGYIEGDGVKYQTETGVQFFTKNALRQQMKRQKQ